MEVPLFGKISAILLLGTVFAERWCSACSSHGTVGWRSRSINICLLSTVKGPAGSPSTPSVMRLVVRMSYSQSVLIVYLTIFNPF